MGLSWREWEEVEPRTPRELNDPLTPEDYEAYVRYIRENEDEIRRQEGAFEERLRAEQEEEERQRLAEEEAQRKIVREREIAQQQRTRTLEEGFCPIEQENVDEMMLGECGHGVGTEAAEEYFGKPLTGPAISTDCPTCKKKGAFRRGERKLTHQGKMKSIAGKLSARARYPKNSIKILHNRDILMELEVVINWKP